MVIIDQQVASSYLVSVNPASSYLVMYKYHAADEITPWIEIIWTFFSIIVCVMTNGLSFLFCVIVRRLAHCSLERADAHSGCSVKL